MFIALDVFIIQALFNLQTPKLALDLSGAICVYVLFVLYFSWKKLQFWIMSSIIITLSVDIYTFGKLYVYPFCLEEPRLLPSS